MKEKAMTTNTYANQKFWEAVYALIGSGDIRMRLTYAADSLIKLQAADIPDAFQARFNTLRASLTSTPLSNDVQYTPRDVSEEEGIGLAREIFELYRELVDR